MRHTLISMTIGALLCCGATARAAGPAPSAPPKVALDAAVEVPQPARPVAATPAEPDPYARKETEAMVALGLFGSAALAGGVAATIASANAPDDEEDGPEDIYDGLAVWAFLAGTASVGMMTYLLMERLQHDEPARAAVTVVPRAGRTGAGASLYGRF
jgi:hypothetical protein